jgi:hypothetical protein
LIYKERSQVSRGGYNKETISRRKRRRSRLDDGAERMRIRGTKALENFESS